MNTMQFTDTQLDTLASIVAFLREHRRKRLAALYRFFVPDVPLEKPAGVVEEEYQEEE